MSTSVNLLDEVIGTFDDDNKEEEPTQQNDHNSYPRSLIRQYSGDLAISDDNDSILGLDEDFDDETNYENMTDIVKSQILTKKYAKIDRTMDSIAEKCRKLILGFTRKYYKGFASQIMPKDVIALICTFYPDIYFFCWNDKYISLESSEEDNPNIYILLKKCCSLSAFLKPFIDNTAVEIVRVKKVRTDILELIVRYLVRHSGVKPEAIAKPIRSVKMERIVADKWDADYVNGMTKKTIFQVILGANYMDVPSLLHLGCAKIATLIKGKSPEEIRNILADESVETDGKESESKNDDLKQGNDHETDGVQTEESASDDGKKEDSQDVSEEQTIAT